MRIESFNEIGDEIKYRNWLKKHADDGYVANRWRDEITVVYHRAGCWTLTANRYRRTTPEYPELCGSSISELRARVKKEWKPEIKKECGYCL